MGVFRTSLVCDGKLMIETLIKYWIGSFPCFLMYRVAGICPSEFQGIYALRTYAHVRVQSRSAARRIEHFHALENAWRLQSWINYLEDQGMCRGYTGPKKRATI